LEDPESPDVDVQLLVTGDLNSVLLSVVVSQDERLVLSDLGAVGFSQLFANEARYGAGKVLS